MVVRITDAMAGFLERERLGFVATVSPDNKPNVSPKGSIVRSGEHAIAFAEIRSPDTIRNLESNPAVEVSVISPLIRKGYLFAGTGVVVRDGPEFERLVERFRKMGIKSPIGAAVVIQVERIEETRSPLYDLGYTEERIRDIWQRRYAS